MPWAIRVAAAPVIALLLAACVTTTYNRHEAASDTNSIFDRQVVYHLADAFYADPPACVAILPTPDGSNSRVALMVENALTRHLMVKVPRVIDPPERNRLVRTLAVDLSDSNDRSQFARLTNCRAFLRWTVTEVADDYAVVLSSRRVGVEVEMIRASDGAALWKASHVAARWDGGVPLSPLSVPAAALRAAFLLEDDDVLPSMVDDAVRRMFVTLPDVRW